MILKTNNSKMKIQVIPSLKELILKQTAEMNATKSESERRQLEEKGAPKNLTAKSAPT